MEQYYAALGQCSLFDGIRQGELPGLLGCLGARIMEAKKGSLLFREGESTDLLGIVLSGAVELVREDYFGNRSLLGVLGPLELFGEAYAFSRVRQLPVSIAAPEDCRVLLLDSRRITTPCCNACDFHSKVIFNLLRLVSDKNLMLLGKLRITSRRTTREKLMAYLLSQAQLHRSSSFTIPHDRQALADYLEVDRSGLSAEISKLRKEGILESEKNRFRLLKQNQESC